MRTFFDEIKISTKRDFELVDITKLVESSINKSKIKNGFVVVFTKHTTTGIRINEYEQSLMKDFHDFFEKLAPEKGNYGHNKTNVDGRLNAHSHLQSMLTNSGEVIPVKDGSMLLGQWQTIFFMELDGPRPERKVTIEVLGE